MYPYLKDYPHMFDEIDTAKIDREIESRREDLRAKLAAV
jgi:hypothetical protein